MDLSTSYLGRRLPHPFMAGASPLGYHLDTIRRLEDAGCAAIALHSLFEEQITLAHHGRVRHRDPLDHEFAEALADFPATSDYAMGPDEYAEHVSRVKQAVAIPVIGSLNGTSAESWLRFARMIQQAGADALELNLYEVVTDLSMPSATVEHLLVETVALLKRTLSIPVAVKVSPFFAVRKCRPETRRRGRRRPGPLQSLLSARHRHQDDEGVARRRAFHERRAAAATPLARHSAWTRAAVARRHRRRRHAQRRHQGSPGRCGRRPVGFSVAASRARLSVGDATRARTMDGVAQAAKPGPRAWPREPGEGQRSWCIRTSELHPDASELESRVT
jgi:hypothetical protein